MEIVTVKVNNKSGIHARPAALLIQLLGKYKSSIQIIKNCCRDKPYMVKNVLSVIAMGAEPGNQLTFEVEGNDEKEAIDAIKVFFDDLPD